MQADRRSSFHYFRSHYAQIATDPETLTLVSGRVISNSPDGGPLMVAYCDGAKRASFVLIDLVGSRSNLKSFREGLWVCTLVGW